MKKTEILSQGLPKNRLRKQVVLGIALLVVPALTVLTAFGIAPTTVTDAVPSARVAQPIDLPEFAPAPPAAHRFMAQERVLRGDTVAALFDRLGVSDPAAIEFLKRDEVGRTLFRQLVPGRILQADAGEGGQLLGLRYFMGPTSLLEVTRGEAGFQARQRSLSEAPRQFHQTAVIRSSLFAATDAVGIPDAIAMQLTRVFATDIDFHSDLRKGDRVSVVYEMAFEGGEVIGPGRILAAEFVNDGRVYQAVLFTDEDGTDGYFSLDGTNRAKAFLRSPLEFSRVSSGFGARFHPIFKNWRAHTGVDFAAAHGTRVLATADGHVVAAGPRGGYGNTVEIRHGSGVTTLYAHLSGFAKNVRAGSRVAQGEAIGYVGATGFATGPHLHYEFKMAGVHQDPLRVPLPKADPIPAHLKARFVEVATAARTTIQHVSASTPARFE